MRKRSAEGKGNGWRERRNVGISKREAVVGGEASETRLHDPESVVSGARWRGVDRYR